MNHSNMYAVGLALCTFANIASEEMSRDLANEIEKLLGSSNTYIRKKVCPLIRDHSGEKHDGFVSAPRAIMTECAPVISRTPLACVQSLVSPFSITAMPFPMRSTNSTISLRRSFTLAALSLSRMLLVRQSRWTVKALTPVLTMRSTSLSVSS